MFFLLVGLEIKREVIEGSLSIAYKRRPGRRRWAACLADRILCRKFRRGIGEKRRTRFGHGVEISPCSNPNSLFACSVKLLASIILLAHSSNRVVGSIVGRDIRNRGMLAWITLSLMLANFRK